MSTTSSSKSIENTKNVYRDKYCMKKFCKSVRDHVIKINNFEKKKMKLVTKQLQESYQNAKICYIHKEKLEKKYAKDKKYSKVRDCCHYTGKYSCAAHSISNLKYIVPSLPKNPVFLIVDITRIIILS